MANIRPLQGHSADPSTLIALRLSNSTILTAETGSLSNKFDRVLLGGSFLRRNKAGGRLAKYAATGLRCDRQQLPIHNALDERSGCGMTLRSQNLWRLAYATSPAERIWHQ